MAEENTFIQEVTEELKAEKLSQFWQNFGSWIMGGCVIAIGATAAYQYHLSQVTAKNQAITSTLLASDTLLERKQAATAVEKLQAVSEANNAGGVALLAKLKAADILHSEGNDLAAHKIYGQVAANTQEPTLAEYALLRLQQQADVKPDAAYSPLAQELQAIALYREGKKQEASALLTTLLERKNTLPATQQRLKELQAAFH
jgi:hypothetical protein